MRKAPSYSYLVKKVIGNTCFIIDAGKRTDLLLTILIVIGVIGSSISYQIIMNRLIQSLLVNFGCS